VVATHLQSWTLTYADPTDTQTVNPLTGQALTKSGSNTFLNNLGRHLIGSVELLLGKNFALRYGYNYEMRQELQLSSAPGLVGMSGGFEMKIYKFHISYALTKYSIGELANTFTFTFDTSQFY
jgi:hypothetical protein